MPKTRTARLAALAIAQAASRRGDHVEATRLFAALGISYCSYCPTATLEGN